MWESKEPPQKVFTFNSTTPDYTIRFYNENKEIGCLDFSEGVLKFTGEAEKSAQFFFEEILKPLVDEYIRNAKD